MWLAAVGLFAAGLQLGGCSRKGSDAKPEPAVDCNNLCDKTFGSCVEEVLLASGKLDKKKLALFRKLNILPKITKEGHKTCLEGCRSKKGHFSDAKAVNACIAISDCKRHAACIARHIK